MTAIPNTARELTLPSLYRRTALLIALATGIGAQTPPPQRIIQTFAGADFTFQGDGKPAITAPVGQMDGVAVDAAGNIYAADKENNIVFQVQLDGILKILAGNGFRGFGPDNVPARSSSLNAPISVAIGPDGSIYVADSGKIRRIGLDGIIKTVAGGGTNFPGDGSQATSVSLNTPTGIVFDAAGNLYFSDQNNQRVVKVTPAGVLTTIAGVGRRAGFSGDGGPGTAANLNFPYGLRFALDGSLLIADTENNRIRKLSLTTGIISTFAGGGNGGDGGPASQARITTPKALDIDRAGTIYILESVGLRVRRISPDGIITSVAGSGSIGFSGDGGPALSATLHWPQGMAVDRDGSILIADTVNRRIRRVSAGRIDTIVGNGTYRLTPDGTLASLSFFTLPTRVVTDTAGRVYVVDRDGALIRRIGADGKIVTIAGNGNQVASSSNGPVSATSIGIADLYGIAIDSNGNVFFVESLRIRRVTPEGVLTTFAGGGTNTGGDGGPATAVALNQPRDLAFDAAGNLYVSERTAHRIRKISPGGIISTVAGTSSAGFGGDGGQATQAQLNGPLGLALDSVNNLYIADPGNRRIRMVSPNGLISTVAGGGSTQRDGVPATQSSLNFPFGVVVDTAGSLYISDPFAQRIRVVNAEGRIDTFAGTGTAGFAGDGGPPQSASFRFNGGGAGIGLDRAGNLYIADTENFRIRVIPSATPTLDASTRSLSFTVRAGDAPPPPLQVTLTSSVLGLPFSIATSQPFLVATPTGLSAPSTLNITVNPATLNPGTSTGTVTITPSVAGVAPIVIAVTVTVQQPLTTRLSVDNTSLPYAFAKGAAPAARRLLVSNAGSAAESFTVIATTASGGNWLTVTRCPCAASASAPFSLSVIVDPNGLSPGAYSGSIEIRGTGAPIVVTVTATVSAAGQLIRLSQRSLFFLGVVGGGVTPPQAIDVLNDGQAAISFTARPVLDSGTPGWLQLTTTSTAITVSANLAGLPPGDHFGRIQVTSQDAENSPREVVVVFRVLAAGTDPGPVLDPVGLVFTSVAGGPPPPSQSITIANVAARTVSYGSSLATFPPNGNFLLYQPSSASIPTGSLTFVVQPNFAGLSAGVYLGAITFQFDNRSIRTLALLVVIAPAGTTYSTAPKNDPRQTTSGCTVKELLPLVTSLGANFNLPASYPATVNVKVVDNCGAFHTAGTTNVTFSNGDAPLSLEYTKNGVWTQSWQSANPSVAQVTVTASAENAQFALRGKQEVTGGLSGTADVPFVPRNGIISASSFAAGAPLAPGSMISIYGARLSSGLSQSPRLPLETELAGTRVSIGGRPAPLLFSSDGQINAIVPFATNPASMIVARGTKSTAAIDLPMAAAAPGIFTVSGTGTGQGHIYVAQQLANEANPAKAGDTLVLYCTGLGALDSTVADGGAAPLARLVNTQNPVSVSIGGIPVNAGFAGLSPGFAAGLYQVNVVVPPGVARSNSVPVTVSVAGQTSPPVTIAVQ